jgi:predicted AlkP superfamily phosphohydrolase/phosphomutase
LAELGGDKPKIVVVSDHGFADFTHKVHLNRWLVERGYLTTEGDSASHSLEKADWARSKAYAVGLNSVYANLAGREGRGSVSTSQYEPLIAKLSGELMGWRSPDGRRVVQQVWRRDDVLLGPLAEYGPDIVVGYSRGHRASQQTGLGEWGTSSLEPNRDHWGGDHCMDSQAVPGVLLCNQGLREYPDPSYRDMPSLTIGTDLRKGGSAPPAASEDQDDGAVAERLRGLGYL